MFPGVEDRTRLLLCPAKPYLSQRPSDVQKTFQPAAPAGHQPEKPASIYLEEYFGHGSLASISIMVFHPPDLFFDPGASGVFVGGFMGVREVGRGAQEKASDQRCAQKAI